MTYGLIRHSPDSHRFGPDLTRPGLFDKAQSKTATYGRVSGRAGKSETTNFEQRGRADVTDFGKISVTDTGMSDRSNAGHGNWKVRGEARPSTERERRWSPGAAAANCELAPLPRRPCGATPVERVRAGPRVRKNLRLGAEICPDSVLYFIHVPPNVFVPKLNAASVPDAAFRLPRIPAEC